MVDPGIFGLASSVFLNRLRISGWYHCLYTSRGSGSHSLPSGGCVASSVARNVSLDSCVFIVAANWEL